jgi:hypothetical protein
MKKARDPGAEVPDEQKRGRGGRTAPPEQVVPGPSPPDHYGAQEGCAKEQRVVSDG